MTVRIIPAIGFGTGAIDGWQVDSQKVIDTIAYAIDCGYRYLDAACFYGNERSVGKGIQQAAVARDELFICSKIWLDQLGYDNVLLAAEQSRQRLQVDYHDLLLLHWPDPKTLQASWQALEYLVDQGKVRYLGVSNYRESDLEQLLSFCQVAPVCNQIECHPYYQQETMRAYCHQQNIQIIAWSPLGSGEWNSICATEKPISDPVIANIADHYGVSSGQVILRWLYQLGVTPIPKSETPARIKENLDIFNFSLEPDAMQLLQSLNKNTRLGTDPNDTEALADLAKMVTPK